MSVTIAMIMMVVQYLTPITLDYVYSIGLTIYNDDGDGVGSMIIAPAMDYMTFIVTLSNNHIIDRNDNDGCSILTSITLDDVYFYWSYY